MTEGGTGESAPDPEADVMVVTGAIDHLEPGRLGAGIRAASTAVTGLSLSAALTALVAGLLISWATGARLLGLAVAAGLVAVGAGSAAYVAVRARSLADSLAHPREVVEQARDLARQAKGSPELGKLARQLRGGRAAAKATTRFARVRRVTAVGRAATAVIGLAQPDPRRHPYLVPFRPERLRGLWFATTVGLWTWAIASVIAAAAALALLVQLLS